jgi:hypothetical protein
MHFPTSWAPYFRDTMSVFDVYHYGTQHFDHHRKQLTLSAGQSGPAALADWPDLTRPSKSGGDRRRFKLNPQILAANVKSNAPGLRPDLAATGSRSN